MNFYFGYNNSSFLPLCYESTGLSALQNSNCTLYYPPLALNSQIQYIASLQNFSENITTPTEELTLARTESEKRPKRRQKNYQRQQVSAKKNGESNIINSYFSFILSKFHSEQFLRKVAKTLKKNQPETQKIISVIYNIMRLINMKRARRYINKAILCEYFVKEKLEEMFGSIQALTVLNFDDLSSLLRKCFFYYLNQTSLTSILTSKRIPIHSKHIHLQKRRKMRTFVCQQQEKLN